MRPDNNLGSGFLPRLGVLAYLVFMPLGVTAFLALAATSKVVTAASIMYALYINSRAGLGASKGGRWPTPLRRWSLWGHAAAYFPTALIKTAELDPAERYIFVYAPHGVASVAVWFTFDSEATGFATKFPGVDVRPLTLETNFRIPLVREFLLLHGICDASRAACRRILAKGPGSAILLAVGGAQESLLSAPHTLDLVLDKRKGFVRFAAEFGASLVPVIGFGENELYDTYIPARHSWAWRLQRLLLKSAGFTLPYMMGVGFFSGLGLMPKRVPLNVVVGPPVKVPLFTGVAGSAEHAQAVDEAHAAYVTALRTLYNQHKDVYAKGRRRSLDVVE